MGRGSAGIYRLANVVFLRDFSHVVVEISGRSLEFEGTSRWAIELFVNVPVDFVVCLVLLVAMTVSNSQLH